jgi:4-hydroxybenzoate polyprenyltransferase
MSRIVAESVESRSTAASQTRRLVTIVRELRPRQWTKDLIVYAALIFSGEAGDLHKFGQATLAVVVFCLLSGSVYVINDMADVERDRLHPTKRLRPLASGALGMRPAAAAAAVTAALGLALAAFAGPGLLVVASAFLGLQLAYSLFIKQLVILDAMAIAGGFVLRVAGGAVAIGVSVSPWIILCTGLLALFLALVKRRYELVAVDDAADHRPALAHYTQDFLDSMIAALAAATIVSYCLYTFLAREHREPAWMMLTIPFVVYGLFRYLYLVHLRGLGGNPDEILVSDVPLIVDIVLFVIVALAVSRFA